MQKLGGMGVNKLLSFQKMEELGKMNRQEKIAFKNEVKKQAAYYMLSVSRAVEVKDYKTAKSILIYIADSCSCIEDPDGEVRYLIEVCCQHLALIREMELNLKEKDILEAQSVVIRSEKSRKPIYVFRYNKFSGEFECDEDSKADINQSVLFYMSKLNSILINYQNSQNLHSILAMLKIYYPYFLMASILVAVLFVLVFSNIVETVMADSSGQLISDLPIIITCLLFIIPLLKIYTKKPLKKDSHFFEKRLGQEIMKINTICALREEKIKFFMPEGIEINVEVSEDSEA